MCCRYYYDERAPKELDEIIKEEGITAAEPVLAEPGHDVLPSTASTVICGSDGRLYLKNMYWGFANPYKRGLIINARAETAKEKKLFSDSVMNRRCIIPASGFYEWDRYKARFRFTSRDGDMLLLAGFYRLEQGIPKYTILTTDANESMLPVHDRMPVMISRSEVRPWITENDRISGFLSRPQPRLVVEQDSGQIRMDF